MYNKNSVSKVQKVPRFPGNSLDPPLRSRFQGRHIQAPSSEVLFALASKYMPNVNQEVVKNIISFVETLRLKFMCFFC
jgi:hypothetical protein